MAWSGDFSDLRNQASGMNSGSAQHRRQGQNRSYEAPTGQTMNVSVTGASRMNIADLSTGFGDVKIVGVIIGKEEPRSFPNKKDPTQERHVVSFTIRDSPTDFINVTFWGGQQYIQELATSFHLEDVVELENVGVQKKPSDGSEERFHPKTSGPFTIMAGENRSQIRHYDSWDQSTFTALSHIPVKSSNDFYTIADITANGKKLHGQLLSLLVVIKSVGEVKNLTSKAGRPLRRMEVKVFDNTAPSFTLVLWDEELIGIAQAWVPKQHVIFAADVKVTFDEYKKSMIGTATSNTIITTDPETNEAIDLYNYAKEANVEDTVETPGLFVDKVPLETITNVYNIEQIKNLMNGDSKEYGVTYAFVTEFNIDNTDSQCIMTRCGKCRRKVDSTIGACVNPDCPQSGDANVDNLETSTQFKVSLSISDHTGTMQSCQLNEETAQHMTNSKVEEFLFTNEEQKTDAKWQYLLERCKIYFRAEPPTIDWPKPRLRVLSCSAADPEDTINFLQ